MTSALQQVGLAAGRLPPKMYEPGHGYRRTVYVLLPAASLLCHHRSHGVDGESGRDERCNAVRAHQGAARATGAEEGDNSQSSGRPGAAIDAAGKSTGELPPRRRQPMEGTL